MIINIYNTLWFKVSNEYTRIKFMHRNLVPLLLVEILFPTKKMNFKTTNTGVKTMNGSCSKFIEYTPE